MRHAFLITAYRDPIGLTHLLDQLGRFTDVKIYLTIDQRSTSFFQIPELIKYFSNDTTYVTYKKMLWGAFSHLHAYHEMINLAIRDSCDFIHTMTGQCRLIKPIDDFLNFFEINFEKSFIEYFRLPTEIWPGQGGLDRIRYFHSYDLIDAKKYPKLSRRLNKHSIHLQKIFNLNRLDTQEYYGGSGYYSINRDAAEILSDTLNREINKYRHTFCPEEIAPQTILINSMKKHNIQIENNNLRYILWKKNHAEIPGILDEKNLLNLRNSNAFFARKFDSLISEKLQKIIC